MSLILFLKKPGLRVLAADRLAFEYGKVTIIDKIQVIGEKVFCISGFLKNFKTQISLEDFYNLLKTESIAPTTGIYLDKEKSLSIEIFEDKIETYALGELFVTGTYDYKKCCELNTRLHKQSLDEVLHFAFKELPGQTAADVQVLEYQEKPKIYYLQL